MFLMFAPNFVVTQKVEKEMKMAMQNMMYIINNLGFGNEFNMRNIDIVQNVV